MILKYVILVSLELLLKNKRKKLTLWQITLLPDGIDLQNYFSHGPNILMQSMSGQLVLYLLNSWKENHFYRVLHHQINYWEFLILSEHHPPQRLKVFPMMNTENSSENCQKNNQNQWKNSFLKPVKKRLIFYHKCWFLISIKELLWNKLWIIRTLRICIYLMMNLLEIK